MLLGGLRAEYGNTTRPHEWLRPIKIKERVTVQPGGLSTLPPRAVRRVDKDCALYWDALGVHDINTEVFTHLPCWIGKWNE